MISIEEKRQRVREWHRKKYKADPAWAAKRNARSKEWVKQQKAMGLCTKCSSPATHETVCVDHFWKGRESNWKKQGIAMSAESLHENLNMIGYKCPLCRREIDPITAVVDHCHATGKVRGFLCVRCNCAIGALGDTEESLKRVVAYLAGGRK